jgi:hypothetical protein
VVVAIKGVRDGLPDSVLAKESKAGDVVGISVSYAPTSYGARYRTQTWLDGFPGVAPETSSVFTSTVR